MKIFWSWQSDVLKKENRHLIEDALGDAVARIGADNDIDPATRGQLAVDQGTKGKKGATEIAASILEKIASCAVFVCDLTPISKNQAGKALPNPNVCIELGYALHNPGPERVIIVLNEGSGYKPEHLPFDVRGRAVMTYNVAPGATRLSRNAARTSLSKALEAAIRLNISGHLEQNALGQEIVGVPAAANDRSIWATAGKILKHQDFFSDGYLKSVQLSDGPRAYLRVTPSGWTKPIPGSRFVHDLQGEDAIGPIYGSGLSSGDGGVSREGALDYLIYGGREESETRDLRCYFSENGEVWYLIGFPFPENKGQKFISAEYLLRAWAKALRRTMKFMDKHGASSARKVEIGCVGIGDVKWLGRSGFEKSPSQRDEVFEVTQGGDWKEAAQIMFLLKVFNKLADAFGKLHVSRAELEAVLNAPE